MLFSIEDKIFKFESIIIIVSLMAMFLAVVVQVIARMLGLSSIGMSEIGMLGMSVLTFIGTAAITYSKDYITIELEQIIKSKKVVHWMKIITNIIMIIFGVLFVTVAYPLFLFTITSGDKTLELGIPVAVSIGAMLLGVLLLVFHSLCDLLRLFILNKDDENKSLLKEES